MLNDGSIINVYNHNEGIVTVPSHINPVGHMFTEASQENPSIIPLTFGEIRFINGQSKIFREGFLKFEPEVEEEVFKALQVHNWKDIMSEKDIMDMILNPTQAKLERIIKITSISMFERIRNILTKMKNVGMYDISNRVVEIIEYRYQELYRNRTKSELVVTKTKQETIEEVKSDLISSEIQKIRAELEVKIRAEIQAEMSSKEKEVPAIPKKPSGRPPKNS